MANERLQSSFLAENEIRLVRLESENSMGRCLGVLVATLCFGACGSSINTPQCFFAFKNIHHYSDENFDSIGDKLWLDDASNSVRFHQSGYHLFIEADCGIESMKELTSYFEVPYANGNEYEIYEISELQYEQYRTGVLDYP
ncbi:MAG: hypothetical protein NXH78_00940 [Hyphomonadaceae bacterium]|nr:hypothetical protein [Hyphomonadaceae bacterium]